MLLGLPTIAAIEEMFTIDPPPVRRMTGVTNFVPKNAPFACTASTRSQSCSDVCSKSNEARIPALFTSTSRRP